MKRILLTFAIAVISYCSDAQSFTPTYSISTSGSANGLIGGYTFAYAASGSPWNGAFMSFGGFSNNYDCQISTDYGPNSGNHISFRTHNGDANLWNSWNEIWHSGNLNNNDADFRAKNVYVNGNLWAKQIVVALANPWPDYVFKPVYHLPSLSEVKIFIDQNQHLPDMPSAENVSKDGLNLGEMLRLQTKKIEELTLYLIEKEQQIKEIKAAQQISNQKLQEQLKAMQDQLNSIANQKAKS
jgi:hypothetical protein